MRANATTEQLALCEAFAGAQRLCEAGDWAAASESFDGLLQAFPDDGPSQFLRARCQRAMQSPDAGTDPGVVQMDAK